jgi:two-component system chemotaxis response regulator CheY
MSFNILTVDDSETTRALIRRAVKIADLPGATLYEAANGREALEVMKAQPIHLMLVDLHMPEMNGIELAHTVLKNPETKAIPVAIVSAEPSAARIAELRQAGVKGYLRKPFTPEAIRNLVKPFMEAQHVVAGN